MHVRGGPRHIAQARYPKCPSLTGIAGNGFGAGVDQLARRIGNAEHGELLVGKKRWRVALGATGDERPEDVEPGDLVFAQRRLVTMRIQVVAAIREISELSKAVMAV